MHRLERWKWQKWHLWQVRDLDQDTNTQSWCAHTHTQTPSYRENLPAGGLVASADGCMLCLSCWAARGRTWGWWADWLAPARTHRLTGSGRTRDAVPHYTGGGMAQGWEWRFLVRLEMKACDFGQLGCPSPPVDVHCEDCQLMYHHHTEGQEEEVGICYRLPGQEDEVDRLSVSNWKKVTGLQGGI